MTELPQTTDVIIVGAGPTGLALACVLAGERTPFLLIDRLPEAHNTSRAAVIHPRTLEALECVGVTDRLRAAGIVVPTFTIRERARTLATIRFDRLPTKYPYTLMVPQQITEAILLERLQELGGQVQRPYTLAAATQDETCARVAVTDALGNTHTISAKYLVGADGMHSVVRECAGIGFTGDAYEHSFVLADVRMQWPVSDDQVNLCFSPDGLMVVAPLPGGRHRIVATVDKAPEHPDLNDVQRLMAERGPAPSATQVHEVIWSSRFRVHHRLADHYRAGRMLLAGDAAHVHSPAGGQGMNTGLQDALALGTHLAAVTHGAQSDAALDDYERLRRPVAERVVALTDRLTRVATLRSRRTRAIRNTALATIGRVPAAPMWLAAELSGLRNR